MVFEMLKELLFSYCQDNPRYEIDSSIYKNQIHKITLPTPLKFLVFCESIYFYCFFVACNRLSNET